MTLFSVNGVAHRFSSLLTSGWASRDLAESLELSAAMALFRGTVPVCTGQFGSVSRMRPLSVGSVADVTEELNF